MLKQSGDFGHLFLRPAAFRRLCVETSITRCNASNFGQPPSGGCVLKQRQFTQRYLESIPAAFRRLCVETLEHSLAKQSTEQPPSGGCVLKPVRLLWFGEVSTAAFRRLCVETKAVLRAPAASNQPPSGGCVLKQKGGYMDEDRLRTAAFRRLCVETSPQATNCACGSNSRLQAAVC